MNRDPTAGIPAEPASEVGSSLGDSRLHEVANDVRNRDAHEHAKWQKRLVWQRNQPRYQLSDTKSDQYRHRLYQYAPPRMLVLELNLNGFAVANGTRFVD
jgi:hypothetical protein